MTTSTVPAASDRLSARDLARHTPATRDRYVDFLRAASIAVVVCGHWLMACITFRDGSFETGNALAEIPGLWIATWVLQVMPIFFFVGGFSNFVTIDAMRRKGQGGVEFVVSRAERLLRPVAVLLGVWIPLAVGAQLLGVPAASIGPATRLVCQPLWFVGAYLLVTACAPVMRDLHARFRIATPVLLAAAVVLVDTLRFAGNLGMVAWCNVLFVWLLAQQLGFFYADGSLTRLSPRKLCTIAATAVGALAVLTTVGPYPGSMVGMPGAKVSNMAPPTLCLVALTVFQVTLVMLARPVMNRWLARERTWTAVVALNGVIMTVFLWHLTALLVTVGIGFPLGYPQPTVGTTMWWITRPLWIATLLVPLVALAALFGRLERPKPRTFRARRGIGAKALATAGTALMVIGLAGVAANNLADVLAGTQSGRVIAWSMTAAQSVVLLGSGWILAKKSTTAGASA